MNDKILELLEQQLTLTAYDFITQVETLVHNDGIRYMDAITEVVNQHGLDHLDVVPLIKGPLKEKLAIEAAKYRLIPNHNTSTASLYD